jgi:anti-anti-sigma factor
MFEIEKVGEGEVRLSGRFDASQEEKAATALKGFNGSLTADCAALDYISSSGIGVIIETYKRLHGAGHTFRLVNMNPRVRNVFAYAGLDKLLQIE